MTAKSLYNFIETHISKLNELEKEELCSMILPKTKQKKDVQSQKSLEDEFTKRLNGTFWKSGY